MLAMKRARTALIVGLCAAAVATGTVVWATREREATPSPRPPAADIGATPPLCAPTTTAIEPTGDAGPPAQTRWVLPSCFALSYAAGFGAFAPASGPDESPLEPLAVVAGQYTDKEHGDIGTLLAVTGNGTIKWHVTLAYPAISAPVFVSGTDRSPLVIIASYFGALTAVDLETGTVAWHVQRPLNVYTPAVMSDHDGDDVDDLLVTEGGDQFKAVDEARPHGSLLAVSGRTGRVFAQLDLPSGQESYMPPLLVGPESQRRVVFGTGGETAAGALFIAPLRAVLAERWDDVATVTSSSGNYGWIGVPTTIGVGDEQKVVAIDLGGRVVQFDLDGNVLWDEQLKHGDDVERFDALVANPDPVSTAKAGIPQGSTTQPPQPVTRIDQPVSFVGPVVGDFDCDEDDDILVSRIRGSLSFTLDRTYAVLDARTGVVTDEQSTSGGGHAVPLVARFDDPSCDQALIYLGDAGHLATWAPGSEPVVLPATAGASVTPVFVATSPPGGPRAAVDTASLFTFGCDAGQQANLERVIPDVVAGSPDPALSVCRLDLRLQGSMRTGSFTGQR